MPKANSVRAIFLSRFASCVAKECIDVKMTFHVFSLLQTDPASFQKARSKSLIRRASRKKAKPAEMTDDQCGVQ